MHRSHRGIHGVALMLAGAVLLVASVVAVSVVSPGGEWGMTALSRATENAAHVSLLDLSATLSADFLALAIALLPLPVFHRIHERIQIGTRVRRMVAYITYVIEPKFKNVESLLLNMA